MRNTYIIAYDVSQDKRRRKVWKKLLGRGDALQYSVFQCRLSKAELIKLKTDLWEMLNLKEDRLVIVDVGLQDGRAGLALDIWGKPLEDVSEAAVTMIV